MINDYHHHLREEGGGVFIKAVHDSHVGRACNGCNGSTICIYKKKTSAWHVNVLRIHILHNMKVDWTALHTILAPGAWQTLCSSQCPY